MWNSWRHSALLKVGALVLLTLVLCIPLGEIASLVQERHNSRDEATQELAATYAGNQTLTGPMLMLPWTERWTEPQRNSEGKVIAQVAQHKQRHVVLMPEQLQLNGQMTPQSRYRGIFEVLFYTLDAKFNGHFTVPSGTPRPSEAGGQLQAGTPMLAFALSDVRGIVGMPQATLGGISLKFQPGMPGLDGRLDSQGIHAPLSPQALQALQTGGKVVFELGMRVVGHGRLDVVPLAEDTQAQLNSPWPHPSFGGRFLATERSVTDHGFEARWRVSSLTSDAQAQLRRRLGAESAQVHAEENIALACSTSDTACAASAVSAASVQAQRAAQRADHGSIDTFAVTLAQPVDVYVMAHRAAKYGALIIALVLMGCFMFELFRRLRLHPVQYGLVGLSIALFFLLLVGLSEKLSFQLAYALSASASVALLMAYFSAVLQSLRRGLGLGAFVAVLYGALYGLLASENNALLLGALLTFGMLSALMLLTRKVDWYALSHETAAAPVNVAERSVN